MKIVVVVDENSKEWFEGKNLRTILHWHENCREPALEICEGERIVGYFRKWIYWREVKENEYARNKLRRNKNENNS